MGNLQQFDAVYLLNKHTYNSIVENEIPCIYVYLIYQYNGVHFVDISPYIFIFTYTL